MPRENKCPDCGSRILFDIPDEEVCRCGWSVDVEYERGLRQFAGEVGEDFDDLMTEFGGDLGTVESYLHAMSKDD
jgi:hypothetical protein